MSLPTIVAAGAAGNLLLITDHKDPANVYRVPKNSVCNIADSSNAHSHRLDINHANGEITLIFSDADKLAAALAAIDELY
ncbi:MAG: hypothetical protein KAR42_15365 [candidate division Zixibacteria bacterium]|nr:hypothetical protein [candidate division Zixibacteria bacterium]